MRQGAIDSRRVQPRLARLGEWRLAGNRTKTALTQPCVLFSCAQNCQIRQAHRARTPSSTYMLQKSLLLIA